MAKILIADADEGIRKVIAETLQDFGHTLFMAEDGNKAMEIIQANSIHVVLADKELPSKDGMEILQEIKNNRLKASVVLMLGMDDEDAEEILDAGAFATLSKPFNVQEIRRIISEAIPHSMQALTETVRQETQGAETEKVSRKPKWVMPALIASSLLLIAGAGSWFFVFNRSEPIRIYAVPYANLSGIALDGQSLWSCDWFNQSFYKHNIDAILSLERTVNKEEWHPAAIAWDGKNLWSYSSWEKKLVKHKMDKNLAAEQEFEKIGFEPSALCFDGSVFWACDSKDMKILKFSVQGPRVKILESAASPGQKPVGIFKDKKFLWTFDSRSGLLYKHSPEGRFSVVEVYSLPTELQKEKVSCFTSDGKKFWIGTETSQKIYQLHPRQFKLVGTAG